MTPHKSKREKEKSKRGNSHCHVDLLEAKIMFESTNIFLVLGYLVATKKKKHSYNRVDSRNLSRGKEI